MWLTLPPKRWETADSSKYDAIRYRPWFGRLLERKWQIPFLEAARQHAIKFPDKTQESICEEFKVSPREFRDYLKFKHYSNHEITKLAQEILDFAYDNYVMDKALMSFSSHIQSSAKTFGQEPRPYQELWEVCPEYWPTGYCEQK